MVLGADGDTPGKERLIKYVTLDRQESEGQARESLLGAGSSVRKTV